ncbi:transmembrane protein 65 [Exaiptasia diaphana]|uniref:Transmembrane protein 65 n=1 Tax=Exaiptasia diaphana TaxID=2652724 RepID=A0A913WYF2_EXADI|nr:transmembrane protein 65 [Exaiptasia diaphana]KXJ27618.1 Transmembrane protein 65 [Exaiptasia diaphana]
MNLCGCGRLSVNISRLLTSSRRLRPIFVTQSLSIICRRSYRRGEGSVISSLSDAEAYLALLSRRETKFLSEAIKKQDKESLDNRDEVIEIPTVGQLRLAAFHSAIPFIGFGFLDNAIMIAAGEYIDLTIGATLGISTMAAAALGNIVSDVSGIGLAHYVELAANKLGFEGPGLSSKQMELPRTRFVNNVARAFGIVIGCIIGMFPLLFIKDRDDKESTSR